MYKVVESEHESYCSSPANENWDQGVEGGEGGGSLGGRHVKNPPGFKYVQCPSTPTVEQEQTCQKATRRVISGKCMVPPQCYSMAGMRSVFLTVSEVVLILMSLYYHFSAYHI